MKQIVRIYYKSDFSINMPLPEGYDGQEFVIRLFVDDKTHYYEAKYNGETYTNCTVDTENNVVNIYADTNHNLPAGCLHILTAFDYDNNHFHDGIETMSNVTETNIYLVKQNANAISTTFLPSALPDLTGTSDYITQSDLNAASYASTSYVADYVATYGGNVDLTGYATETYVAEYVATYAPMPDMSEYVSHDELNAAAYASRVQLMLKQDALVSGQNIKTINGQSVLGSGNMQVYVDMTGYAKLTDLDSYVSKNSLSEASYVTQDALSSMGYITTIPDEYVTQNALNTALNGYVSHAELSSMSYVTQSDINSASYVTNDTLSQASYVTEQALSQASYATQSYVAEYVIEHGGDIDLSSYVTKTELDNAGYITSIPSEYITESELSSMGYITSIPSEYITESELSSMGYLTEHQDLSSYVSHAELSSMSYVTQSDINSASYVTNDALSQASYVTEQALSQASYVTEQALSQASYVTEQALSQASYATQSYVAEYVIEHGGGIDLSAYVSHAELNSASYVTKTELNNAGYITSIPSEYITESELSAMGYITSIPSEYITESELSAMGYLTEHQDLSAYVSNAELNSASYATKTYVNEYVSTYAADTTTDYSKVLTFTAAQDNSTVSLNAQGTPNAISLQYSTDNAATWQDYTIGTTITLTSIGDTVKFKGINSVWCNHYSRYYYFSGTGQFYCSGDVTSLLNGNGGDFYINTSLYKLFAGFPLITAPDLPSTSCGSNSYAPWSYAGLYQAMFAYCSLLKKMPKIALKNPTQYGFSNMFEGCTALEEADDLLGLTIPSNGLYEMFRGCTNLKKAPVITGTMSNTDGLARIFNNCTNLHYIKILVTTNNFNWNLTFVSWSSSGTLVLLSSENPTATLPNGWTAEKVNSIDSDVLPDAFVSDEGKMLQVVNGYWGKVTPSFATQSYVADYVAEHGGGGSVDLSSYLTYTDFNSYVSSMGYVTQTSLSSNGYLNSANFIYDSTSYTLTIII